MPFSSSSSPDSTIRQNPLTRPSSSSGQSTHSSRSSTASSTATVMTSATRSSSASKVAYYTTVADGEHVVARPSFTTTEPPKRVVEGGLFGGLSVPYSVRYFVWRRRVWFESTFVFSMLEPWEKILLLILLSITLIFFLIGLVKYLPHRVSVMHNRAQYYLYGAPGTSKVEL